MKVVWDFAGVLFRWRPPVLLRRCLPSRVVDDDSAAHWVREIFHDYAGDWAGFDRGTFGADQLAERIARRTGLATDEVRAVVEGIPAELQPVAETVDLVARLRAAGVAQVFLSNMPGPYADRLEAEHRFLGDFDDGVYSARAGHVKPEAAIFEFARRRFAVPAAELLFFDDHVPNVDAARAAGWNAEPFTTAAAAESVLRDRGLLVR